MILGHHMGEQILLAAAATGGTTAAAAGMLAFGRARLETAVRWLLRR